MEKETAQHTHELRILQLVIICFHGVLSKVITFELYLCRNGLRS